MVIYGSPDFDKGVTLKYQLLPYISVRTWAPQVDGERSAKVVSANSTTTLCTFNSIGIILCVKLWVSSVGSQKDDNLIISFDGADVAFPTFAEYNDYFPADIPSMGGVITRFDDILFRYAMEISGKIEVIDAYTLKYKEVAGRTPTVTFFSLFSQQI